MMDKDLRKNTEGYTDLTAYRVIKSIDEEERFHKLLHDIFYLCEMAEFKVEGRIVLIDKKTGRVWR